MPRTSTVRRSLALTTAVLLTSFGASAAPALADPGKGNGSGQSKHADKQGKGNQDKGNQDKGNQDKGNEGKGPKGDQGHNGNHGQGNKGGNGDPAGNNGTVKITPHGEMDGIPNNSPHPGCVFDIEWYGFDEGEDIVSTVEFAMHAPTQDVGLSGTEPSEVFVGGDPATGAGTETGLDGEATYTLVFDGEPHPQQGYHVKLTVHTPDSKGADTKHKVFWVEPCEGTDESDGGTDDGSEDSDVEGTTGGSASSGDEGEDGSEETEGEVLGTQASSSGSASSDDERAAAGTAGEQNVPNSVDAGEEGNPVFRTVTSPLWLSLLGGGMALVGAAIWLSRRPTH